MDYLNSYLLVSHTVFFIISIVFSLLINGLFLKFSKNLGIRNTTDTIIRWGPQSKPAFGGISFFIVFLFSLVANTFIYSESQYFLNIHFIGIVIVATLGFLMGLFDDAYNTKPRIKFSTQILCSVILIFTGTYIEISANPLVNYTLTVLWVVGMMNSINMLDNMDAVTISVTIIVLAGVIISFAFQEQFITPFTIIILGVLASVTGFLKYNWHPSKMYMGDTGSQFLGVFLSIISIHFLWNKYQTVEGVSWTKQFIIVGCFFLIPLIDTTTVFIKRIAKGKSPLIGGKDHTTHHLSYFGFSDRQVVYLLAGIAILYTAAGIYIQNFVYDWGMLHLAVSMAFILLAFGFIFAISCTNNHKEGDS